MSINGQITLTDDDAFVGYIASLTFDVDIVLIDNEYKNADNHPDYQIMGKSPTGREIRVGSAWKNTGQKSGKEYLSLAIDVGTGQTIRANALQSDEDGLYRITPLASKND